MEAGCVVTAVSSKEVLLYTVLALYESIDFLLGSFFANFPVHKNIILLPMKYMNSVTVNMLIPVHNPNDPPRKKVQYIILHQKYRNKSVSFMLDDII